jgi:hypothetical protein
LAKLTSINNHNNNNNHDGMTLEERLVRAFSDTTITASELAELILETEKGIADAEVIANRLEQVALDPVASADPVKARETAEFAQFAAQRLRTVLPRLEQRHQQIIAQVRCTWRPR